MVKRKDGEEKGKKSSESNLSREMRGRWARKKPLEKALSAGIMGKPQLRREEKRKYLGEFRERVIRALKLEQIHEKGVYPEIVESIKDYRAKKLVISSKADLSKARDYIMLARKHGLLFTTVDSPDYRGEIGLVVVSDSAVDEEEIMVETLQKKLARWGFPTGLAEAENGKVCSSCYRLLEEKAPPEILHKYRPLNWWDKLTGRKCPCTL